MADYDFTDGSIAGHRKPVEMTMQDNQFFILRNVVDFSLQTLDAGDGDTATVLNIPADTIVYYLFINVLTAETDDGTIDVGDNTTADYWLDGGDSEISATGLVPLDTTGVPIYYSSADAVTIKATTDTNDVDIDGAKIEFIALCVRGGIEHVTEQSS
jgi:hypothetical protein